MEITLETTTPLILAEISSLRDEIRQLRDEMKNTVGNRIAQESDQADRAGNREISLHYEQHTSQDPQLHMNQDSQMHRVHVQTNENRFEQARHQQQEQVVHQDCMSQSSSFERPPEAQQEQPKEQQPKEQQPKEQPKDADKSGQLPPHLQIEKIFYSGR